MPVAVEVEAAVGARGLEVLGLPRERPAVAVVAVVAELGVAGGRAARLDGTGDVAVAKVYDECLGTTFTDYLTLIKHDGQWQIVMKAFYDHSGDGNADHS